MKISLHSLMLLSIIPLFFWGCSSEETAAPTTTNLTIVKVFDMEAPLTDGWLYYSFDKEAIIPASQSQTDQWDIKFRAVDFDPTKPDTDKTKYASLVDIFLRKGFFFLNSGTVNPNGKTVGTIVDSAFTQITTAPDDTKLQADDTTYFANPSKSVIPSSFLTYTASSHTVAQNASKTLIVKTKNGTYVKVQILSMYKNHPPTPSTNDDVGYYSIAFVKGEGKRLK